jgi:hypothetical protein
VHAGEPHLFECLTAGWVVTSPQRRLERLALLVDRQRVVGEADMAAQLSVVKAPQAFG